VFAQHLRRQGMDAFMLFAGAPIDQHRSRSFNVVGVRKRGEGNAEGQAVDAELRELYSFADKLLAEDEPVLNTMRFRKGVLVASDRHLARYFKYVSEFPLGAPPAESAEILASLLSSRSDFAPLVLVLLQDAPPDVPPDRVAVLRAAFDATMTDAEFLADAHKQGLEIVPGRGDDIERVVGHTLETPPDAVARLEAIIGGQK